jgi:hypothetical protein
MTEEKAEEAEAQGTAPVAPTATVAPDHSEPARRARPILGPALVTLGALLWAFVVMGTYTTSWFAGSAPLGEGFALMGVVLVTVFAWISSVRRSRPDPAGGTRGLVVRAIAVALAAFGLWAGCMFVATLFGMASSANMGPVIEGALLLVAGAAAFIGNRSIAVPGQRRARSPARRAVLAASWIGVALVTLGACAEMMSEG